VVADRFGKHAGAEFLALESLGLELLMANRRAVPITSDESITWLDQDSKVGGLGLDFDEVPAMLGDVAGAEWARLGVVFADQPTRFREGDRSIVVAYCLAWSIYLMATAELASDGLLVTGRSAPDRERRVKSPAMTVWSQAGSQLRYLARELGLSPDSRGRMGLKDSPESQDDGIWS
jgi:P27 family predicted phage terminase small subunit